MNLYAIRNHDNDMPTGYYIGSHGPVIFGKKIEAEREAARLNSLPHAPGRVYRVETIHD
jgi:hypothetical protein